jgi:hypothetical protein
VPWVIFQTLIQRNINLSGGFEICLMYFIPFTICLLSYDPIMRRIRCGTLQAGVCEQCGYDLRATPARCPECGKVVEKVI